MTTNRTDELIRRFNALSDDAEGDAAFDARMLLIDDEFPSECAESTPSRHAALRAIIRELTARASEPHDEYDRYSLSMLLLSHSLCPMHAIDYAICFDDDEPQCATIRAYFPCHDT